MALIVNHLLADGFSEAEIRLTAVTGTVQLAKQIEYSIGLKEMVEGQRK